MDELGGKNFLTWWLKRNHLAFCKKGERGNPSNQMLLWFQHHRYYCCFKRPLYSGPHLDQLISIQDQLKNINKNMVEQLHFM